MKGAWEHREAKRPCDHPSREIAIVQNACCDSDSARPLLRPTTTAHGQADMGGAEERAPYVVFGYGSLIFKVRDIAYEPHLGSVRAEKLHSDDDGF